MDTTRVAYGGVEGGGTKFVCALGTGPGELIDRARIATTGPEETLRAVAEFFTRPRPGVELAAVGVACFGPLDLRAGSRTYGWITSTPKPGWRDTEVAGTLSRALGGRVPVAIDTDVNGAALGEWRWGAGRDLARDPDAALAYVTVGTGVGGGAVIAGRTVRGARAHPEMGHVLVPPWGDAAERAFAGVCPFHGRCLEGLASGPAVRARTGRAPEELSPDDPLWETVARYIAHGLHAITAVMAPARIVLGGGVGSAPGVLARVRSALRAVDNGYTAALLGSEDSVRGYVVAPELGDDAGVLGAIALAQQGVGVE